MFDTMERDGTHHANGADPIERIESAVADLAGEDRNQWTSHALSERVVDLVRVRKRLDAELLRVTGLWDRTKALIHPSRWTLTFTHPARDPVLRRRMTSRRP